MKFKNEECWREGLKKNTDSYGSGVYRYAERWAELMETAMDDGVQIEDVAKRTSHDADTEGITGFMYGCAVSILSACWLYGESLRKWHNLETQIRDEGKKANESGGVLNPALLNVEFEG